MDNDTDDLLERAKVAFTLRLAAAFDDLWTRPGAEKLMRDYIRGDAKFLIERDDVFVLGRDDEQTDPGPAAPLTGQYL